MTSRPPAGAALAGALALLVLAFPFEVASPDRPGPGTAPAAGAVRLLWGVPLDLNREEAVAFEALAGIGPMRARAIVAGRPYCGVAELDRVPGIGPRTLEGLAPHVAVVDPPSHCVTGAH